ncbi:MAG: class I SAM-dependent methyltransferase [Elusimicrobia bacterium]|nr:class I SAM-dependent methyltransferase [Elusimicrobiota bacterium]
MGRPFFYDFLSVPAVFRAMQTLVAPGAEQDILRHLEGILSGLPKAGRILDVGCGPDSWLWKVGLDPVGVDLDTRYVDAFNELRPSRAVVGSAEQLPFPDHSFDAVWSFGLLHHVPENVAAQAVREMVRVCAPGGAVVVFDAVLPEPAWKRPAAWAIRSLDRGEFMRSQAQLEALFPDRGSWDLTRIDYARSGLEGAFLVRKPGRSCPS